MTLGDARLSDSAAAIDAGNMEPVFTHKMMKPTDENNFASLGYECNQCTFEQFLAIEPRPGWSKGPTQVLIPNGILRSTPSFEGVPSSMDFVPEIPGNEYKLIVKNLNAKVLEIRDGGAIVEATVMRDTLLRFPAGSRVHELTNPEGDVFVLFAHHVDPQNVVIPDFQDPNVLGDFPRPEGWVYSTRIIDEELALDSINNTTVLAIRTNHVSTWEKR